MQSREWFISNGVSSPLLLLSQIPLPLTLNSVKKHYSSYNSDRKGLLEISPSQVSNCLTRQQKWEHHGIGIQMETLINGIELKAETNSTHLQTDT